VSRGAARIAFIRMLSSAVTMQALVSGGSFLVGLILIRRTTDTQYGYYVLVANAILLLSTLQLSFIQPPLVTRLSRLDRTSRIAFVGGLYSSLRRLWPYLPLPAIVVAALLRALQLIDTPLLLLIVAGSFAIIATLYREFFRIVLLAYRQPEQVLRADAVYVALIIAGAWLVSTQTSVASLASCTLGAAAIVGGYLCTRSLRRFEPWDIHGSKNVIREIAPLALWSTGGAAIHWLFSQGYSYVVAGTLDVGAVAAIAAMRLLVMPINLLSTGLGSMMLPTISTWLNVHTTRKVFGRQLLFSLALGGAAIGYFAVIWLLRDRVFDQVLKKHSASFDVLLLLWSCIALLMLFRDQLIYLLVVKGRFRSMAGLTFVSAVLALTVSYLAMQRYGVTGALMGVLLGEAVNVAGIVYMCLRESSEDADAVGAAAKPTREVPI
jgi:O-antigen/teichoic acid export membrane protein